MRSRACPTRAASREPRYVNARMQMKVHHARVLSPPTGEFRLTTRPTVQRFPYAITRSMIAGHVSDFRMTMDYALS
jgi:hypothetical protein